MEPAATTMHEPGRLLIVSNRLPLTMTIGERNIEVRPSSGGLATGMRGPHQRLDSLWIGWPGDVPPERRSEAEQLLEIERTVPVWIDPATFESFYDGFSNGVLWPLFHYFTDHITRVAWTHWQDYVAVNEAFADVVATQYRDGDLIWVHDYQLCLLPEMLRKRLGNARIGFFMHIPFPAVELFRVLPWRREILDGMLGADLIGFHTTGYRRHFIHAAKEFGARTQGVKVEVFPMGINTGSFEDMARSDAVKAELKALRRSDDRRLVLGVDRLDYTKGLQRRLLAFEELLTRNEDLRGHVRMLQIVVPSRTSVSSYEAYKRELEELVGGINGRFSTLHNDSVRYLFQSVTPQELVALYSAADVMLVTPLRDGMNLVAKEFAASRVDEDGVLILSELAGAADQLTDALLVNPYDIDGVATALRTALDMPAEARHTRMRGLRKTVSDYDVFLWANNFIEALMGQPVSEQPAIESIISRTALPKV